MSLYELVIVIVPDVSQKEREETEKGISSLIGTQSIKKKDDMGLVQFSYDMKQKRGMHQGFVISYYIDIDSSEIDKIKKELSYNKNLLRYVFYAMTNEQKFFLFEDLIKDTEHLVESDERTMKKNLSLFVDRKNEEYLVWKAIGLLRKFVTRFGDIKPRKYTGITVTQQKKVRLAIMRARELGFMPYIK